MSEEADAHVMLWRGGVALPAGPIKMEVRWHDGVPNIYIDNGAMIVRATSLAGAGTMLRVWWEAQIKAPPHA